MLNNCTQQTGHGNLWQFDLRKRHEFLNQLMVAVGWDFSPKNSFDLDLTCFLLGADGKLPSKEHLVFYNNLVSPDQAVEHSGDNSDGKGEDADEIVLVNLEALDESIHELVFVVFIDDAGIRDQVFGLLKHAFVAVEDAENQKELLRYRLDTECPSASCVNLCKLHKVDNEWQFQAEGSCSDLNLENYLQLLGA